MQTKSAALQEEINSLDLAIQQGASDAQLNLWEMQRDELRKQLQVALAEEESHQATTESAGFIFDTLEVDGLTAPEIITDDSQYNLIRKGVQNLVVTLTTDNSKVINNLKLAHEQEVQTLTERVTEAESKTDKLQSDNKDLELKNYELGLENDELSDKVTKIAALQHETNQQIEQQKKHIEDLQNQIAIGVRGALNVVEMPQDTSKMAAEIIARKVRITNVRFKDENGIDTRIKKADNVLTGEPVEYEALYEKRYIILNAEQAEQYRADEANKKAEELANAEALKDSIPVTQEEGVIPVNAVLEEEAPAAENSFQEVPHTIGGGDQEADRNESLEQVVAEESKINLDIEVVFTLEYVRQLRILEEKVANIESKLVA